MEKPIRLFVISVGILALGGSPARADFILYDNGPIKGDPIFGGRNISEFQVTDSFTLADDANLTRAQVGLWLARGYVPPTVDWAIGTAAFGANVGFGTASLSNVFYTTFPGGEIDESAFALSGKLTAGTYWLTLKNVWAYDGTAVTSVFWDNNQGPSRAEQTTVGGISSESFQIYGDNIASPTIAPVPSTLAMSSILLGIFGVVWSFERLRETARNPVAESVRRV